MNDPERLVDDLAAGFERDLLLLGGSEEAPENVRRRVEARAMGAAGAALAGSSLSAAAGGTAAGKSASALGVVVIQWLAVGAVAGGVTALTGSAIADRVMRPAEPTAPVPAVAPAPRTTPRAEPLAEAPPRAKPEPAPVTHEPRPGRAASGEVRIGLSSTLMEAAAMRRIRVEAKRDPGRALTLVNQYLVRFPDGAHVREAKALQRELIRELDDRAR